MLIACLLFLAGAAAVSAAAAGPALRRASAARAFADARQGLFAASSVSEDVAYRKIKGLAVDNAETLVVGSVTASASLTDVSGGKEISAESFGARFARASTMRLAEGTGVAVDFGVEGGAGGGSFDNSSSVCWYFFCTGPGAGSGSNVFCGDVISAGAGGLIEAVHATGTARAHTIRDSDIDGDAYYQTISGTTVGGTLYPGSTDQTPSSLPISNEQIEEWKADALAGGTHTTPCSYTISSNITLGPKKINCNMKISGSPTITLAGPLWVAGTLEIENSVVVRISGAMSGQSVAVVADDKITLQNTASFEGTGANSYILLISQRTSGEGIIAKNNSVGGALLLYAPESEISLENSMVVKEASAYRIRLKNSVEVVYETGLANLLFTAGPSGGYTLGSWKEVE